MKRRDFLKTTALAGLAVAAPLPFSSIARAEEGGSYEGPLWITINASGGWDPTMLCDPKGGSVNSFDASEIESVGPFQCAPIDFVTGFFNKYKGKLVVLNGIDTQTNSHSPGMRHTWSGSLTQGYPTMAALMAAASAPEAPMAFINDGGYEETANLITATRADDSKLDVLKRIAHPNYVDAEGASYYHDEEIADRIQKARMERLQGQRGSQSLPRVRQSMNTLYTARLGQKQLRKLTKHLDGNGQGSRLIRQSRLTLAAYQAGLCVGAHLSTGGFDTHSDHDNKQSTAMKRLIEGVDFIMDDAEERGIADQIVIVVSSEFSRTPGYNSNNGKDHWPYTSMFLMAPGRISGGRVIGATDDLQGPMRINPNTLEVVGDDDMDGVRLQPGHIQHALRKVAGIENSSVSKAFPVKPAIGLELFED
jgi:uncharacterized protein (DUF1501 family)